MFRSLLRDALFIAAVLVEVCAALSLAQALGGLSLPDAVDPPLSFYRSEILPAASILTHAIPVALPPWFADAYVIAALSSYLFFIRQAHTAMAPHTAGVNDGAEARIDMILDASLPPTLCAIGSSLFALTLLPLLTPLVAFALAIQNLGGSPAWFAISRTYYVNLLLIALATMAALAASR